MLLTLFQTGGEGSIPDLSMFIVIMMGLIPSLIFYGMEVGFLKLGLTITKAPGKRSMKWVCLSVLIQIGLLGFIIVPLLLLGFSGGFENFNGIVPMIISVLLLLIFLWVNLINALHRPGIKRSLLVFLFMLIPIIVIIVFIGISSMMFSMMMSGYSTSY